MPVAGIDLGGTKLAVAAFSDDGDLLYKEAIPLAGRNGSAVGELIASQIVSLASNYGCDSAGVCVPGLYRASTGTVWAPNIPGWDDYPLLEELTSVTGAGKVAIDSDRAAYILGETWRGAARGLRDAVFLAVGTGIGAGIISDGRIIRGYGDVAGAIGWLALDRPFASRFVQHGCFEDQASGPGLVRVARDLMASDAEYNGALLRPNGEIDAGQIFAAHADADRIATKTLDNAIELWGMAAANLVSLLNPQIIVFGGGIFGPAIQFLGKIKTEAKRWAQPIAIEQVRFVGSELGPDAGLYGAGYLALSARERQ